MTKTRLTFAALLTALASAAPAAAQDPLPTPTPSPTPAPAAAPAMLKIAVAGTRGRKGHRIALRGDRLTVSGSLQPAAPGQRVIVRLYRKRHKLLARQARMNPDGGFAIHVRAPGRGPLSVRAVHRASPQLSTARARSVRLAVVRPSLTFGARGELVRLFQAGLDRLRYPVPHNGLYDAATGRAVMAFRKVNRFARLESADESVVRRVLAGHGSWRVRYPKLGHHVEADLSQQVMSLVDGKRLVRTYPVSSGKPSTPTIRGRFRVYSKTPGTNQLGMVHSSYFQGGYAIHGYFSVPAFAASHGCLRVPVPNAWTIYNWIRLGDAVVVDA
jgi:hypothetical protein